jgi:hypothetical protein
MTFFYGCAVVNCSELERSGMGFTSLVYSRINSVRFVSMLNGKEIKITGLAFILINFSRKRFSLCHKHYLEFKLGVLSPLDYFKVNKVF